MTINFGALSPIQAPQVIGSLPQTQNVNPLAGISAALQGAQDQALKTQQATDQHAESLQRQQANSMSLEDKQIERRDAATIREAASQGEKQYVSTLMKIAPDKAMNYLKTKQDIQESSARTFLTTEQGNKAQTENADSYLVHFGDIAHTADNLKNPDGSPMSPEMKIRFVQGAVALMPKPAQQFFNTIVGKNGLTQETSIAFQIAGSEASANIIDRTKKKQPPSDTTKRIDEINQTRKAAGQSPLTPEETLDIQNKGLNKSITPTKVVNSPTALAIGQADAENLKKINERKTSYNQADMAVEGAQQTVDKVPGILLNPISNLFSGGKLNKQGQILESYLNRLTLIAKAQYNMGSQGFTDADRKFVQAINGDLSNYKGTLKYLLDNTKRFTEHARQQDWLTEYNIHAKDPELKQQFLDNNPEPLVKVQLPNGKTGTVPVRQLNGFLKDTKSKVL